MDITDFLNARIAEDEYAAHHGISGQADPENGWGYEGRALTPHVGIIHEPIQAAHIIRWHPARVLAECAAKRAIIAWSNVCFTDSEALHHLAAVYADHPEYDKDWAP